ncbi:hypothetical protein RIF29_08831 [Crotalaria pallida]|uniref:Uncharacterized protein n=1 Tax=Crotalaria pallida TaxID=3830 RepID=A0AAN9FR75_CROPI
MYGHDSKSCRKKTRKVWIEKRKPSREDTEKVDEALNLNKQLEEGLIPEENIESASRAVKEVLEAQCVEGPVSVVRESQPEPENSEFIDTVSNNWKQEGEEFAMFILMRNLDNIRPGLKDLNNRKYRDIDMREIQARKRLDSIQDMLQLDPLNNHLQKMEKEARKEHLEVYQAALMFLRQKAKQDWICEGDLNTKFFHQSIRQRRLSDLFDNSVANNHQYSIKEGYEYLMGELQVFNHHRLIWNPARRRQVVICSLIVYGAVN